MSRWHRDHPDQAEAIAMLPPSEQSAAERMLLPDPLEMADQLRKERKESPCPECSGKGTLLAGSGEEGNCYACNGWGIA